MRYLVDGVVRGIGGYGNCIGIPTVGGETSFHSCYNGNILVNAFALGVTTRDKTYLWGHSAGGQFVHRLLATQPHGIFAAVGAANSGWYTLPTLDVRYPDGLGGIGLTEDDVVRFLGYPLVLFSGDQDIHGATENFPKHESAMAQGPNRFARAQFYLERGRAEAARLRVPCRWSRVVVPGVAHEGMRMSAFAGDYWFGGRS